MQQHLKQFCSELQVIVVASCDSLHILYECGWKLDWCTEYNCGPVPKGWWFQLVQCEDLLPSLSAWQLVQQLNLKFLWMDTDVADVNGDISVIGRVIFMVPDMKEKRISRDTEDES